MLGVALTSFQSALGEATISFGGAPRRRLRERVVVGNGVRRELWATAGSGFYKGVALDDGGVPVARGGCRCRCCMSWLPDELTKSGAGEIRPKRLGSFWERTQVRD